MAKAISSPTFPAAPVGIRNRSSILLALLFLLLNLALKLPWLASQPIALDEPFSIFHAQQSLPDLFELFPRENNPPLYFLVLHSAISVFGIEAWAVRLPSLIFACLAAALLFRIGERHFGRMTGIAAATLFTLCNFHTYHAHEARTYSLFVLLTLLALDRFLRLADEPGRTAHYFWLGIWNALLIYSHFLGFWLILAQGAGFFFLANKGKTWWRLGLSWTFSGLLYLPFLYVMLLRAGNYATAGTWVWKPEWTELYGNVNRFLNGKAGTLAVVTMLLLAAGIAVTKGKFKWRWPGWAVDRKFLVLGQTFVLIYFGMFGISFLLSPVFLDRYLLFLTVPLFLVIGRMIEGLFGKLAMRWAALGLMVAGMGINLDLNPSNQRPVQELFSRIKAEKTKEVPLVLCPPFREWLVFYHLDRDAFRDYRYKDDWFRAQMILPVNSEVEIPDSLTSRPKFLYLDADSQFTHPENGILERLRGKYASEEKISFGELFALYVFQK